MSAMVLSSTRRFGSVYEKLKGIGAKNVYFYSMENNDGLITPMLSLVPFVDVVVFGKDANYSTHMTMLVDEAMARHIPIVSEECIGNMKECL